MSGRLRPGQFLEVGDLVIRDVQSHACPVRLAECRVVSEDGDRAGDIVGWGPTAGAALSDFMRTFRARSALGLARRLRS
jgi:hypothetical protein